MNSSFEDEGGGAYYSVTHRRIYAVVIALFAAVGVVVNSASLITLGRKKRCSMFHNLLKVRPTQSHNVWGRIRNHLQQNARLAAISSKWLGEGKVEIAIDDLQKTLSLKAVSENIRKGIKTECTWLLTSTAKIFGYEYLGVESIEANDSS